MLLGAELVNHVFCQVFVALSQIYLAPIYTILASFLLAPNLVGQIPK
jgi:hypothetical protein